MLRRMANCKVLCWITMTVGVSCLALVLLISCGGGGEGGGAGEGPITPISPPSSEEDVSNLFPLTQGLQWVYKSEGRGRLFVDGKVVSEDTDIETIYHTIVGIQGDPFSEVTVIMEEKHEEIGGGGWSSRNFWTNQGGEVKLWGHQEKKGDQWGDIEKYEPPLVLLKSGKSSWEGGRVGEKIKVPLDGKSVDVRISFEVEGNLVGQQVVTVPAGTFECHVVKFTFKNPQVVSCSVGFNITTLKIIGGATIWLAKGKGEVKWKHDITVSLTIKDLTSGKTINVTTEGSRVNELEKLEFKQ